MIIVWVIMPTQGQLMLRGRESPVTISVQSLIRASVWNMSCFRMEDSRLPRKKVTGMKAMVDKRPQRAGSHPITLVNSHMVTRIWLQDNVKVN